MREYPGDEKGLFLAVLERGSPQEQANYLAGACAGDPELRQRIEELLHAHLGTAGPFDASPPGLGIDPDVMPPAERPGTTIGPYTLVQQIGEGGMGTVYLAAQTQPVKRQVALKVIKPGMDSRQVIARFEAERQALALMDHGHIARVFDGGTTPAGRPYFVMELVHGVPITQFCDDNHLTVRARLELFVPVCQAIQHAHHKGIIHRDIKPSNVLIARVDGKPVPKVIDFGVAKATEPMPAEETQVTQQGAVGTLEYMSPEQAERSALGVDTRSDVYALGVLLYELLTGSTPLNRQRLQGVGYAEILRLIKEEDPPRPSTRLSAAGDALTAIAVQRGTETARLVKLVRGELDWIVMKSLEKDRTRRYETANGFAADVQRYLSDEPVLACPPSAAYRLRKFVKRQRSLVLATTGVFLALVAGIVGTTLGLVEAQHQRDVTEETRQAEAAQSRETQRLLVETQWLLYASRINLAKQAWEGNNAVLAFHHLESCRPEFRGWEYDYLNRLFHSHRRSFGHKRYAVERVSSVVLSADGQRIVSGNHDKKVRILDADTGRETRTLIGHTGSVLSVAVSADDQRIVSGSIDQTLKVWDANTGRATCTCTGHTGAVLSVALSPDGRRIVSGSSDHTLKVWEADTGRAALILQGHTSAVSGVAFSPDGKRIASASVDRTVRVWDAVTGREVLTLKGHTDAVNSVAFRPDGRRLASASADQTVTVWDADTGKRVSTLMGNKGPIVSVAISPDGRRIVSGSGWDNMVKVWDADTGEETATLRGHTNQVSSVAVMPDGRRIVSGSWDNTVKVWDAAVATGNQTLKAHQHAIRSVAFSPNGKRLVSGDADHTVKIWDTDTGAELRTLRGHANMVTSAAFSPDGKRLVSGSRDQTAKVWDAETGTELLTLEGHTQYVNGVAFSPDGKHLVSAGGDWTIRVWDAVTGKETQTLKGHMGPVTSVAFSPDGKRIVSGGNTVKVWAAETGIEVLTLKGRTAGVASVAFSPDGSRLVSGSSDQMVRVWDAAAGHELLTLGGHTGVVSSVAWTPDGKRIVSGSHDQMVKLWDAATGYETLTLTGHPNAVNSVALSPDGKRVVSGSTDGTIMVWDARPVRR